MRQGALCMFGILWAAGAAAQELAPFVLPWDDTSSTVVHAARWLGGGREAPAGAKGFVSVDAEGHLCAGGQRLRLLGVNLCFGAAFPRPEDAPAIAARMAKFGINAVRFHHMDSYRWPTGILATNAPGAGALAPEALERLDLLVAELARNGIYSDLNLLVSRHVTPADGVTPAVCALDLKQQHLLGFFDTGLLDLQKQYARALLLHTNAITGRPFAREPAVAIVEIQNENGLIHGWLGGQLDAAFAALATASNATFEAAFTAQWNTWLRARHADAAGLKAAWRVREEPLGADLLRNADFAEGLQGWNLERHDGAQAEAQAGQGAVRITVSKRGSAGWHVQFNQADLAVEAGRPYTVEFEARADAPCDVNLSLGEAHPPWQTLGFQVPLRLEPEWRAFRYTFTPSADDSQARLHFSNLGSRLGRYEFAKLRLRPGGRLGLEDGESLEGARIPWFRRAALAARTPEAQSDWIRFLRETEAAYWQAMYRYLKRELGVQALVVGTITGCSTPTLMSGLDAVDAHGYWQHPQFPGRPWDSANWRVVNTSMVNEPGGVPARLALARQKGKPFLVTEYNHSAPNTYSSEAPLLLAALAALQDWDGVFLFAYSHRKDDWAAGRIAGFFDMDQHPPKMANLLAAAALFRRADVAPAREWRTVSLDAEREVAVLRTRGAAWQLVNAGLLGLTAEDAVRHRVGLVIGAGSEPLPPAAGAPAEAGLLQSDTGELAWDTRAAGKGFVTVSAPRSKAVVGFAPAGDAVRLGDVLIRPGLTRQGWCTVTLTLVEGQSFRGPARIVAVATGDAENTAMGWKDAAKSTVGRDWGRAPSLVEVVPAEIGLPVSPSRVTAWALDERGARAQEVRVEEGGMGGLAVVRLGPPAKTVWYEIEVR